MNIIKALQQEIATLQRSIHTMPRVESCGSAAALIGSFSDQLAAGDIKDRREQLAALLSLSHA